MVFRPRNRGKAAVELYPGRKSLPQSPAPHRIDAFRIVSERANYAGSRLLSGSAFDQGAVAGRV